MVKSLIINNGKAEGVITSLGIEIKGKSRFNEWNFPKRIDSRR